VSDRVDTLSQATDHDESALDQSSRQRPRATSAGIGHASRPDDTDSLARLEDFSIAREEERGRSVLLLEVGQITDERVWRGFEDDQSGLRWRVAKVAIRRDQAIRDGFRGLPGTRSQSPPMRRLRQCRISKNPVSPT